MGNLQFPVRRGPDRHFRVLLRFEVGCRLAHRGDSARRDRLERV